MSPLSCVQLSPFRHFSSLFFFFNDTAPTEIYTLSLHDALPISPHLAGGPRGAKEGRKARRSRRLAVRARGAARRRRVRARVGLVALIAWLITQVAPQLRQLGQLGTTLAPALAQHPWPLAGCAASLILALTLAWFIVQEVVGAVRRTSPSIERRADLLWLVSAIDRKSVV